MRTEWTWRHNKFISAVGATTDRAEAERAVEAVRSANPGHDVALVVRQVTEWAPVQDDRAAARAGQAVRPEAINHSQATDQAEHTAAFEAADVEAQRRHLAIDPIHLDVDGWVACDPFGRANLNPAPAQRTRDRRQATCPRCLAAVDPFPSLGDLPTEGGTVVQEATS